MYLLPAGAAPRTNIKFAGLRGLGAVASRVMTNGGAPRSNVVLWRPPILPGPMPVWPGGSGGGSVGIRPPTQRCSPPEVEMDNATWDPVGCRWVPNLPKFLLPPNPMPPAPVSLAPNAGTPVPSGFPVNQFFVAPDGSVWQFGAGKWFNTGTPNTAGGSGGTSTPASSGGGASSAPSAPVSVTVAPAAAPSGYQAILDWLTQSTLISPVPNWIVGSGIGLIGWKMFGGSSGGKR